MQIQDYLELVYNSEQQLSKAFSKVAKYHQNEPDIYYMCLMLALWSIEHAKEASSFRDKYARNASETAKPDRLNKAVFNEPRAGETALLLDLHDLWLMTKEIEICWNVLLQASKANNDKELEIACLGMARETNRQSDWLIARVKQAAPRIVVADGA